ncbi:MAG: hypothetical protein JW801_04900 [Bacteroidales bacterium]|nr:hypothetical protein [Bacteroidales bacterium]
MRRFFLVGLASLIVLFGSACKDNAAQNQSKPVSGGVDTPGEVLEILISSVEADSLAQLSSIMPGDWLKDSLAEELKEVKELLMKNAAVKTLELEGTIITPSPADKNWMLVGALGKSPEGEPCLVRIVAEKRGNKWFYTGRKYAGLPAAAEIYGLEDPAGVLSAVVTAVQEGDTAKFERIRFPGDPSLPALSWHFNSMQKLLEEYAGGLKLDFSTITKEPSHFNKKDVVEAKIKFKNLKGENCQLIIEAKKKMTGWFYAGYMASKY